MRRWLAVFLLALAGWLTVSGAARASDDDRQVGDVAGVRMDGYRGIWHGQEPTRNEFSYKYSGGLGTYTVKHNPLAIYAEKVNKTFFVYGGQKDTGPQRLTAMIGLLDHGAGTVERPALVHDKNTFDPHDNPSLSIDAEGHLWVFVSGRGRRRPGFIYRSEQPYDIGAFRLMDRGEYTYPQPWYDAQRGFLLLFTKYRTGRQLFFKTSRDGREWSDDQPLAAFGGHYQVSWPHEGKIGTAFKWHPGGNVDRRTNLYYLETDDLGQTWKTAGGQPVELPLTSQNNPALVRDYHAEKTLVYLSDLKFDGEGRPVVHYVLSNSGKPGPEGDPRLFTVAAYNGKTWDYSHAGRCDHNYDKGRLEVTAERWRLLGPSETGPQPYHTGGEIALWESTDRGRNWQKVRQLTSGSPYNHGYVRPVLGGHRDFYAFWADGDASRPSPSRLYFCNHACDAIWQLPEKMDGPTAQPVRVER